MWCEIDGPLCKLFQNSIDRGKYPESWKQACVSALHKKGSVHDCNNKAIRDGKYLAPPHASAWQRSPHYNRKF